MFYVQNISCFSLSPFSAKPLISSCCVFEWALSCQTSVQRLSSPGPWVPQVGGVSSRPLSHRLSQGFNLGVVTRKGRITPRENTNRKNSKLLAWHRVQNYKVGAYDIHSWDLLWEFPKYQLRCSLSMYTTQLHLSHLKGLTSPEEINTVRRSSRLNTKRHCLFWRLREKTTPCLDSVYFVDSILLATACPVLRLAKEWPLQGSWNNP